jgi:acetolactate synthase-1/2/3 large subunit
LTRRIGLAGTHGGEVVAAMLAAEGVDTVFGIIDGTYFGLYSNLEKHGIRLISPRHETTALHMAGTYARLTGKLGVAIASNGPGVANALPGVAVESGEGHRVLLITSSRRVGIAYPERGGTFQYFDQVGVTKPMTKWATTVPDRERMPEMMRRAFRTSWSGRPGVVHVDIPESVINGKGRFDPVSVRPPSSYRRVAPIVPDPETVARVAALLADSELPLIHVGTGVVHSQAFDSLRRVAEALGAPVTTSWGARGALPEDHPLSVPMTLLDTCGELRREADTVLIVGSRVGETDWWGKPPYWRGPAEQTVIQVDVDDHWLGVNKPVDLAVLADADCFLEELVKELETRDDVTTRPNTWGETAARERAKLDGRLDESREVGVNPGRIPRVCQQVLPDDTIWVFDGGNTTVWSQFFHSADRPNSVVATFKFGMLGAGVAQALGAQVARPSNTVCCLIGDGAMGFHPQEVETAVRNDLPVIYVVFVDLQWGMVKMNQQFSLRPVKTIVRKKLDEEETINADFSEIRFDELARSMGAHGERVASEDELAAALERSMASGKPAVIHVDVDPVTHMWAPKLRAFKDMHSEPGD